MFCDTKSDGTTHSDKKIIREVAYRERIDYDKTRSLLPLLQVWGKSLSNLTFDDLFWVSGESRDRINVVKGLSFQEQFYDVRQPLKTTSFDNSLGGSEGKVSVKIPCKTKTRLTM